MYFDTYNNTKEMTRFKKLFRRTRNRAISFLCRKSIFRERLLNLAARSPKVDRLARKIGDCLRKMKAEALTEQIGDKLKNTHDPEQRMALHASIETVRLLAEKGGEIPDTLEELMRFQTDLFKMMQQFCNEGLKPLLMTPQMMNHAAKAEKKNQQN